MILRRHEHGMPVSRSENDLQGPQSAPVSETENFDANLYLPPVPLGITIHSRRMPGPDIEQDFTRVRRST